MLYGCLLRGFTCTYISLQMLSFDLRGDFYDEEARGRRERKRREDCKNCCRRIFTPIETQNPPRASTCLVAPAVMTGPLKLENRRWSNRPDSRRSYPSGVSTRAGGLARSTRPSRGTPRASPRPRPSDLPSGGPAATELGVFPGAIEHYERH